MSIKKNCWEIKQCGREPFGKNVEELGVCPSATETEVDGIHGGKNGGRCCWAVVGTFCKGQVQKSFGSKVLHCMNCDVYKIIWKEENEAGTYIPPSEILAILNEKCLA